MGLFSLRRSTRDSSNEMHPGFFGRRWCLSYFGKDDLQQYLTRRDLCGEAKGYIQDASLSLSRNVGRSSFPAIAGEYQSLKMGACVNVESGLEAAFAIYLDFNDEVLGFYEQPPLIDCMRTDSQGRLRLSGYTPDFVVLSKSGPSVVQVKPEKELQEKISKLSGDWVKRGEKIIDLPAERAFAAIGLEHHVVSSSELGPVLIANCKLLLQARLNAPAPDEKLLSTCEKHLRQHGVCTLEQLAEAVDIVDLSALLALIAQRSLYVDMTLSMLSIPANCLVSADPHLLSEDVHSAWKFLSQKAEVSGADVTPVQFPLGKHLQRTLDALNKIRAGQNGRTQRRHRAQLRAVGPNRISDLLTIAPRYVRSGNRNPGRPEIVLAYCEHVIRENWSSTCSPSPAALYRIYRASALEWHPSLKPVSRPTCRRILEGLKPILARARGGNRAHNALQAPTAVQDRSLKADRPFQLASVDHHLCDIYCFVMQANGMRYAQRPWLTILRDCATDAALAVWISFRDPSRRSCSLIIRQCLRQHGRLPEAIIVDHGSDFRSVFFSTLLAHCGIDLLFRPVGFPEYGSEAEKYFRQFKELWLSARPGNCTSKEEVRSVSGSHRPELHACLTLSKFWEELVLFNDWINAYCAGSKMLSPTSLMAEGLARFSCSGVRIPYDETFLIASAVDETRYSFDPQNGIHIGNQYFWNQALRKLVERKKKKVVVRRDPEHPYRCFAHVDGAWITCLSSGENRYLISDPLQRMAESVLEMDGDKARNRAKEDAELDLVRCIRKSDAKSSTNSAPALLIGPDVRPETSIPEQDDPFESSEAEVISLIKTEKW